MRAVNLSLTTVVIIIVLLVTLVAILLFFSGQFGTGSDLTEALSEDTDKGSEDIIIEPEKIFCPQDRYVCENDAGLTKGSPPIHEVTATVKDPYLQCSIICTDDGTGYSCKCYRE